MQQRKGYLRHAYRCPSKEQGGCGGVERNMAKLDALIEDLLFAHLAANARTQAVSRCCPDEDDRDMIALADVQAHGCSIASASLRGVPVTPPRTSRSTTRRQPPRRASLPPGRCAQVVSAAGRGSPDIRSFGIQHLDRFGAASCGCGEQERRRLVSVR